MAKKTRSQLASDIATVLASGKAGGITAAQLRTFQTDVADSMRLDEDLATGVAPGLMSANDKSKLDGVAVNATANSSDAQLRDRSTHTGSQPASTISDFNASSRAQVEASLVAGANVTITPSGAGGTRQFTIASTGGGGGSTNIGSSTTTTAISLTSSTGTGTTLNAATGSQAGVLTAADKTKLDSLQVLQSGVTIKTINGTSLLGSGDIPIGSTFQEIPTGTIDGANVVFTLSQPSTTPAIVVVNGVVQAPGVGRDYVLSGQTLTFADAPQPGDEILVTYGVSLVGSIADGNKGDISVSGAGTSWTINPNSVVNADLAQVATATFKGRVAAGTGNVQDLSPAEATSLLNTFTPTLKGLAPASGGGTTTFLRADGTWAAPAGGGGAITVADEGVQLTTSATSLNFVGAGVTATNSGGAVTVTIPGGGSNVLTPVAGQTYWEYEEFLSGSSGLKANMTASNSGGTIASLVAADFSTVHDNAQIMGVSRLSTGAAATAAQRASIISPATAGVLGLWFNNGYSARLVIKAGNYINLFDPTTNTGHIILGFANGTTSATPASAAAFISTNGGNFIAYTRNSGGGGGTTTTTDTGIAPTTNGQFRVFDIEINAAGTQAIYRIDGAVVATHTTSIPVTRAAAMGIVLCILRSPATAYSASFDVDSLAFGVTRTTPLFT